MNLDDELERRLDEAAGEAIRTWGAKHQSGVAQEECAELIGAISHHRRKRVGLEKVAAEIADVEMMLRQLRKVIEAQLPANTMRDARVAALNRLTRNINEERARLLVAKPGSGALESWDGPGDF